MFMWSAEIHHHEQEPGAKDTNDCALLYAVSRTGHTTSFLEECREDGVRAFGQLIEITGVLETAARRQCVRQDNNGSSDFVRSEKFAETPSGLPLDACCKCR